jgi:hypothetical protein
VPADVLTAERPHDPVADGQAPGQVAGDDDDELDYGLIISG